MKILPVVFLGLAVALVSRAAPTVGVQAGIDHSAFNRLLASRVDERGLVDYAGWRASAADTATLDSYLDLLAASPVETAEGADEIATLVNAYNAFTIAWILQNYPTESIRLLDGSWNTARWTLGGQLVSLDEIEHKNLRSLFGWRTHAVVICAARSCPPLRREAFTRDNLESLANRAMEDWLARPDLNRFEPSKGRIRISAIFDWYSEDFASPGLAKILSAHAPGEFKTFLASEQFKIGYLEYHWGLNDQSDVGAKYKHSFWRSIF